MIDNTSFDILGLNYKLGASKHFILDNYRTILFSHGLEGNKDGLKWNEWSVSLPTHGFNVIKFNYRGCGKQTAHPSDGLFVDTTLTGRISDYDLVVNSLPDHGMDNFPLGAIGSSFGGMVVAASSNPTVKAIALIATPYSLDFDADRLVSQGIIKLESGELLSENFFKDVVLYDIGDALKEYKIPTLIIHGSEDEVVPVDDAFKLYDSLEESRELHIIEGADHSLTKSLHRQEAINLITTWMLDHL